MTEMLRSTRFAFATLLGPGMSVRIGLRALASLVLLASAHVPGVVMSAPVPAAMSTDMPDPSRITGDMRRFMHGIAAVPGPIADEAYVFFSSIDPDEEVPRPGSSWTHDVYVARWEGRTGSLGEPSRFLSRPEAQEPVSAARNAAGNIMVTFEDGWEAPHTVTQRFGIYDAALEPVRPYPNEVEPGGHSGHVAAVDEHFIVFYSDGWVDGGGEDDLGSGHGVYAKVYDGLGRELHDIDVVHAQRAWWPRLAGGTNRVLLIWQELLPNQRDARLKAAVLDPRSGRVGRHLALQDDIRFYHYDVAWMADIERFLVVGTAHGKGFARLVSEDGEVTASLACMPATVREAGIAVDAPSHLAYTPAADGRLLQLRATRHSLELAGALTAPGPSPAHWRTLGSLGLFGPDDTLHWFSLTEEGPLPPELASLEPEQSGQEGSERPEGELPRTGGLPTESSRAWPAGPGLTHLRFDLTAAKKPSKQDLCK